MMKAVLVGLLLPSWCAALAQPAEFEVASIKRAVPGPQGVWTNGSPDRIRMLNMSLKELVSFAYDLKGYQVYGTGWIESEKYDVIGKVTAEAVKLPWKEKFALMRTMTRALLADRFQLRSHRETKELPAYGLVAAKNGPKVREAGTDSGDNVNVELWRGHLAAKQMGMAQLVTILGDQLERPVLDLTGVRGVFDVALDWTPENLGTSALETKPPLPLALQEQLGLKLEMRNSPIEVMVVERAERPGEN